MPRLSALTGDATEEEAWESAIDHPPMDVVLSDEELDAALEALADFTDLKSPAIAGHSRAVSVLAEGAAQAAHVLPDDRTQLRRAGLVHDIGYAAIPGTQRRMQEGSERSRLHPYFAERLLCRVPGLRPIGAVMAQHHERMDGTGFHRGCRGNDMSAASRLLAVAEAYQNLIEGRPGRPALTPKQAAQRLRDEARAGSLDGDAVLAVLEAAGQAGRAKKAPHAGGLTAREIDVLQRVARGGTTKEIGHDLGLSPKTVDNHIQSIYAKLNLKTRGGATLFALENGLLPPAKT
ncbi:MAG: LuxR C-terminal-related transcriptional regulator [Alphaproteobacteria bacterium]